jgi:hypothetical protein
MLQYKLIVKRLYQLQKPKDISSYINYNYNINHRGEENLLRAMKG